MASSPKRNVNDLTRFAEAQAALWHIAMFVGRGAPQAEVFDAVAAELGQLIGADGASIVRYEADGTATVVAGWGRPGMLLPVGANVSLKGRSVAALVSRTGGSARIDSYADAPGRLAALLREQGIRSTVGAPIVVEGRIWGVVTASMTGDEPLAPDAEVRLAYSTDLMATAIAIAQARADLAASRARVAAVADQARRRIERNLHDGIQQQLIGLAIEVGDAEASIPSEMPELRQLLSTVKHGLTGVLDDLRDISRGIYPAVLSDIGLRRALKGLVRRSPVPVELNARLDGRLPEPVEVAAYFIVAESLANAAKHAHASRVRIDAAVRDGRLHLSVADDGAGGADPARGSGLVGLTDRVDVLGGSITISSPAGQGTHLLRHAFRRRPSLLAPLVAQGLTLALFLTGHDAPAAIIAALGIAWLAFLLAIADDRAACTQADLDAAATRIADLEAELADANTDPVTGLPVRRLAEAHITTTAPASRLSVAVLDVDDMHGVNNGGGHQFGDAYLAGIADRLEQIARPGDMIARLGGDEFVYITERAPRALARAITTTTARPITIGKEAVPVRLSIGICHVAGGDPHTTLGCADLAMYTAKRRRSGVEHYDAGRDGTPLPHGVRPPVRRRDRHTATWPVA